MTSGLLHFVLKEILNYLLRDCFVDLDLYSIIEKTIMAVFLEGVVFLQPELRQPMT